MSAEAAAPLLAPSRRRDQSSSAAQRKTNSSSDSAASAASARHSELSLDDLSSDGGGDRNSDNDDSSDGDETAHRNRTVGSGANTQRVEERLQQNLRRQQEHYTRQRRLFEDLRSDPLASQAPKATTATTIVTAERAARSDNLSPSAFVSSSRSGNSGDSERNTRADRDDDHDDGNSDSPCEPLSGGRRESRRENTPVRLQLKLESELTDIALTRQSPAVASDGSSSNSATGTATVHLHHRKQTMTDYRNDKDALRALSRVKAKALDEYERRMAESQQNQSRRMRRVSSSSSVVAGVSSVPAIPSSHTSNTRAALRPLSAVDELSQQEASNDALRKQLELLRRLQVENNRFRRESRVCREQNEALEHRSVAQEREIKRLHDEAQRLREDMREMRATIEQDQQRLVAAAQTTRKLKSCQKQLSAAQRESERLQSALHEALELQERSCAKAASDTSELVAETKRLKRSLKQLRQQDLRSAEENELLRSTVEALESEVRTLKRELSSQTRECSELSTQLTEKASECEAIDASAAACAQRLENTAASLQKALDAERAKRKAVETQRSALQVRIDQLDADASAKQQHIEQLERHVAQLQDRVKDKKHTLQVQRASHDARIDELLTQQQQDAQAIARLRDDCERNEQAHKTECAATQDAAKRFGAETKAIRSAVETLRSYIERSLHASSSGADGAAGLTASVGESDDDDGDNTHVSSHMRAGAASKALDAVMPELQLLHGATSALRTETMGLMHELQRARHGVRQHAKKLALAQEHTNELERLRAEDARTMRDVREQRTLAEQARDIVSNEKREVLQWSQQTCEELEARDAELQRCDRFIRSLLHALEQRRERSEHERDGDGDGDAPRRRIKTDTGSPASPSLRFQSLEREVELMLTAQQTLQRELEQAALERRETVAEAQNLQRELEAKTLEFERMTRELEALHAANAREQRTHFDAVASELELEREKSDLAAALHAAKTRSEREATERSQLQARIESLERDAPVFATVVRLFALVVSSLVLQVSELLSQKRYLVRENAEYAQSQAQIECIGQVLKELAPPSSVGSVPSLGLTDAQRHRRFRRVVVAVFALNRFHKCGVLHNQQQPTVSAPIDSPSGVASGSGGSFGACSSLTPPPKKRRSSRISAAAALQRNPPATVVKVLSPHSTLASLDISQVLARLRAIEATEKVADVLALSETEAAAAVPHVGSLLVQVLTAIDPSVANALAANTSGAFHCQALIERTRRTSTQRQRHLANADSAMDSTRLAQSDSSSRSNERELSTVDLIRTHILALGKRVEDLYYQRNALQTEDYDLQLELEQQATQLQQMEQLAHTVSGLEQELDDVRTQQQHERHAAQQHADATQQELERTERVVSAKEAEVAQAAAQIEQLQREMQTLQLTLESDKQALHSEVAQLQLTVIDADEKTETARASAKKHEDEVRNLTQAARKAHELYQKMAWQLEHESGERASVEAALEVLKQQKESLEKRNAKEDDREHARASELALEDTCLYHKYEKRSSSRALANSDESSSSSEDANSALSSSLGSQRASSPRATADDANSTFLDEWRWLQIASVFDDDSDPSAVGRGGDRAASVQPLRRPKGGREAHTAGDTSVGTSATATAKQIAREVAIQSNRRRIEIDKVNSTVHDYMDRIDEKLQQMYGIPPSSASSRMRSSESPKSSDSGDRERANDRDTTDREAGTDKHRSKIPTLSSRKSHRTAPATGHKTAATVHTSAPSNAKVDETRHWFG